MENLKNVSELIANEIIQMNIQSIESLSGKLETLLSVHYPLMIEDFRTIQEKKYDKLLAKQQAVFGKNQKEYIRLGFKVNAAKRDLKSINVSISKQQQKKSGELSMNKYNVLKKFIIEKYGSECLIGLYTDKHQDIKE